MSTWQLRPLVGLLLAGACNLAIANTATVYYYTPYKNWSTVYIHHNGSGTWTTVPGSLMTSACTNWTSATIDFGSAANFMTVFNNGANVWDNNNNANYTVPAGIHQIKNGALIANAGSPCGGGGTNSVTVFYKPNSAWTTTNIHYSVSGTWTTPPGVAMDAACTGWKKKTIALGAATGIITTFNNAAGTWDSNGGNNYTLGTGNVTVNGGVIGSGDPCGADTTPPTAPTNLTKSNVTANSVSLSWTASTDIGGTGIRAYQVVRDSKAVGKTATNSFIDNTVQPGQTYTYAVRAIDLANNKSGASNFLQVTTGSVDTTPPTVPGTPTATVNGTNVSLSWAASTDAESGITSYTINRTGGSAGAKSFTSTSNSFTDTTGAALTTYSYSIIATNGASLVSGSSGSTSATTGNVIAPSNNFSWDNATVYFLLNDRFVNADTSNDRSYCRESNANCQSFGNDLTQMPSSFHGGDLKGITQKINANYFKDLGINAIWITAPYEQMHGFVYGNDHKHYAYHGYYTLDWTSIDKNMGTKQDLQDLVDAAHAQGIRVVMDIVLNHVGYESIKDMNEYGYGKLKTGWEATAYKTADSVNWNNDIGAFIDYTSSNWATSFWGSSWIRMNNVTGMDQCNGTDGLTGCVGFLPDVKTEVTSSVSLPPILSTKWSREGRLATEQAKLDTWFQQTGKAKTPANHIIKWLSDYVREYGIDGFRVDTAKHVEQTVWKDLKTEASKARGEWLAANPAKAALLQGDKDFWMTGEIWGHGTARDSYFDNGFDSLINFDFQGAAANTAGIDGTYTTLAGVNSNNSQPYNLLSYISSHDKGLFDRNNLRAGLTNLLMAPGGVQLFYGDETGRPLRSDWAGDHAWRSDMNWNSINTALLAHAQKLGKFRNAHVAVGAGTHTKLQDAPYTFARVKDTDKVVIALGASGTVQLNVGSVFPDGTALRDAYTGSLSTVSGGKATFSACVDVMLIEAVTANTDTTAPTVPTGLTKGAVTANTAALTWSASSDANGVSSYDVYRNSTLVGNSATTSYSDIGLTGSTTYSYTVAAKDAAGNTSAQSAALSITTSVDTPDTIAPSVPLSPVATVANNSISLSWTASTDNKAVTGYELSRTGGTLGAKTLTTSSPALTDAGLEENTAYTYTIKAFDAAGNKSTQSAAVSATSKTKASVGGSFYATNPNDQVGKPKAITFDGSGVEWTEDMIIAQGVANDDPRIFRGSHEGPVYDLYALYASWDDSNLYLMWQFTNVTDVADPGQGFPISDNGKPWNGDIPQQIAFDIDPTTGSDGMIDGTTGAVWGIRNTFANNNVDRIAMFSSKPGVGKAAIFKLNANGKFDYAVANNELFSVSGVSFKYADGFMPSKMMGINSNGGAGYLPTDLADSSKYINFLGTAHNKKQDTTYEMKIPFTALGIDKAYLENKGIGVMLITTFGQSGIGSLPQDPTVLDKATVPYGPDASTSEEKEDNDVFTVPFARIGKK